MSAKLVLQRVVETLQQRKTNLCCNDVKGLLIELGFEVRDGKRGGHKVFVHQGLPSFKSGSFNCGHGKNPEIKPAYIAKILKVLEIHKSELENYLEKAHD